MTRKRGLSPVIATVLLVAIVVVIVLIIFLWGKGMVKESVMKSGKSSEQACNEINLELAYTNQELQIINRGNMPVYRLEIFGESGGNLERITISEEDNQGVAAGQAANMQISGDYEKLGVFPVILGEVKSSKQPYTCKNSFEVELS